MIVRWFLLRISGWTDALLCLVQASRHRGPPPHPLAKLLSFLWCFAGVFSSLVVKFLSSDRRQSVQGFDASFSYSK